MSFSPKRCGIWSRRNAVPRIEAKVAEILNLREVVLNRGSADGVQIGMRFAILNRKGADIIDPDTNKSLGSVEVDKAVVKIVRVKEHLSVGRMFDTGYNLFSALRGPRTFRTDQNTFEQELDEKESLVRRGDPAVQVMGEEFGEAPPPH
jgi:hypothetical protein